MRCTDSLLIDVAIILLGTGMHLVCVVRAFHGAKHAFASRGPRIRPAAVPPPIAGRLRRFIGAFFPWNARSET
jgi:hypothetical protein